MPITKETSALVNKTTVSVLCQSINSNQDVIPFSPAHRFHIFLSSLIHWSSYVEGYQIWKIYQLMKWFLAKGLVLFPLVHLMVDINFGACMYPFWCIFHKLFGGKFLHLLSHQCKLFHAWASWRAKHHLLIFNTKMVFVKLKPFIFVGTLMLILILTQRQG